jgi:hypothetical protein
MYLQIEFFTAFKQRFPKIQVMFYSVPKIEAIVCTKVEKLE